MAFKDDGKRGTVVGGDGEVAALVELSRREAGPVAVNAATADASAQHPDDVSVAMVGYPDFRKEFVRCSNFLKEGERWLGCCIAVALRAAEPLPRGPRDLVRKCAWLSQATY
jgi:hypothetical protein